MVSLDQGARRVKGVLDDALARNSRSTLAKTVDRYRPSIAVSA
jgi:hypothetical protein